VPAPHASSSEPPDGDTRDDTSPATDPADDLDPDGLIGDDETDDLALDRMTTEKLEAEWGPGSSGAS
jgi:hypothetical protein